MAFQFNNQSSSMSNNMSTPGFIGTISESNEFTLFGNMNNSPLEFNINRSDPSISRNSVDKDDSSPSPPQKSRKERRQERSRNRERRDTDKNKEDSDSNLSQTPDVIPIQNGAALPPNMWGGVMGMGYPMVGVNMIVDPNMMSMGNYGMMPPMMAPDPNMIPNPNLLLNPVREIIHCKSCTLFPPGPSQGAPSTRERPPGCRTVFVGGIPEGMGEDIITEVFERCGEISTLRLSKKNFCHIRFLYEASVDAAIFISGYKIRIFGTNCEGGYSGRIHVDYAQARDDQYEWECRQRQLQREQRHRERMEEERLRPPSPPPVVHYTDHEASSVAEKLKLDDTFTKAVQIVITWLERGDCSKRNSNNFYSMIQSTNSHVRRLFNEKTQYEEELQKAKEILKGRMQGILLQFSQIERLFLAACHKKVWDHFTKAQRKNIELWKKQSMEIKNVQLDGELALEKADDEMDVSDEEDSASARKRPRSETITQEEYLREENNNLTMQVEAYKNEVDVIKMDMKKELEDKDKQFKMLQQTMQGMQQQLIESRRKQIEEENKVKNLQNRFMANHNDKEVVNLDDTESEIAESVSSADESTIAENITQHQILNERDAKLIGIISTFLNVHPFGAGLDYIWSYVSKLESNLRPSDIELLMSRFPTVFKQELVGIGANIERRWQFNAFRQI